MRRLHLSAFWSWLLFAFSLLHPLRHISAAYYSVGEVVDTDVLVDGKPTDALRSQMPMFGITTTVQFDMRDDGSQFFGMQFEEGLRSIPAAVFQNRKGEVLDRIEVIFVYSSGIIHTVTGKIVYDGKPARAPFTVQYKWVEEEPVRLDAGDAIMFFAIFAGSVFILFQTCGCFDDDSVVPAAEGGGRSSRRPSQSYAPTQKRW